MDDILLWIRELDDAELTFIKRFILASGSLKKMAQEYDVSYPTIRNHLDSIIKKIKLSEQPSEDSFTILIKKLALQGDVSFDAATQLIREYKLLQKE